MGRVTIRHLDDLNTKLFRLKPEPEEWSEVLKYSPDGQYLAVGSHDNIVYIYEVNSEYKLHSKFNKHNSFVTALDWS